MDANQQPDRAARLFEQAREKVARKDLRGALRTLFELLLIDPLHREGLEAASRIARLLGSKADAEQFEAVARRPEDPQALYDLGFTFVEQGLPGLGALYLERCRRLAPHHPLVRYELGYALYQSGRLDEAIPLLEETAEDEELGGPEPFAARLLLVECRLRRRDLEAARREFELLEPAGDVQLEAQRDAAARMLARAEARFALGGELDAADWHFVLHGGAVLRVDDPLPLGTLGIHRLADLLLRLEALIRGLDLHFDALQWLAEELEPPARALARRLGARAEAFDPQAAGRKLALGKDAAALRPLLPKLQRHEEDLSLFALSLDPRFDQPICPEVLGTFAAGLVLPWEERFEIEAGEEEALTARRVGPDVERRPGLVDTVSGVMEEMADRVEAEPVAERYRPLAPWLVLGHADEHPARRVFTARPLTP